jgi:uncharacterized CHY-type Zn-finger protein/hemin uptake protein HemP
MEYRYYLVALIIIIALICILYPSHTNCSDYNKSNELFDSINNPSISNKQIIAGSCAKKLAVLTYSNVVGPCVKVSNPNNVINCITGYKNYYQSVIVDPISDMFLHLKYLEGTYPDHGELTTTQEGAPFMIIMTKKYSEGLSKTLTDISNGMYGNKGFERSTFVSALAQNLTMTLIDGIDDIYNYNNSEKVQELKMHINKNDHEEKLIDKTSANNIMKNDDESITIIDTDSLNSYDLPLTNTNDYTVMSNTNNMSNKTKLPGSTVFMTSKDLTDGNVKIFIDGKDFYAQCK